MSNYQTTFGSLENYSKGGVQIIDDDPEALLLLQHF